MKKKIDSGAQFFQTQAVFDVKRFNFFMKKVSKYNVPIIAGIILLKSAKMAVYMNDNVAGIYVPDALIKQIDSASDKQEEAIQIACSLIDRLRDVCNGVHIMPIGWETLVPGIIDRAGLAGR